MKQNYKLTHFSLQECASLYARDDIFNEALAYLKRTDDVDGWRVMLYGA